MSLPRLSLCLALACGPALASQAPVYGERWKASTTPIRCIIWTSPPRASR